MLGEGLADDSLLNRGTNKAREGKAKKISFKASASLLGLGIQSKKRRRYPNEKVEKGAKKDRTSVWTETPSIESTTTRAPSVTRKAAETSPLKST